MILDGVGGQARGLEAALQASLPEFKGWPPTVHPKNCGHEGRSLDPKSKP